MPLTILKKPEPWDVVVIGSGATGGWAALELGAKGLKVLVLEAGPDGADAPEQPNPRWLRTRRKYDVYSGRRKVQSACPAYWQLDPDLFIVDTEHPYETPAEKPFHWVRTRAVNGRMLTWGGIGVRVSDHEFRAPEQDGFGEPWPIGYSDLAEHFDRIDRFLPVLGERDRLQQLPDGNYSGVPQLTDAERHFRGSVEKKWPGRRVIASRGVLVRPESRPNGEAAPPSLIREAIRRFGVSLRANAVVSHLIAGGDGKARGVAFVDRLTRRAHEVPARAVAVCASTLESTRILLNSTSPVHPQGLGNSSGTLGRYLMDHPGLMLSGFAPGVRDVPWRDGTGGPKNVMVPRFHNLENRAGGAFLRGYAFFGGIGRQDSVRELRGQCERGEVPFTIVGYGEMLPRADNRVTLSPDGRDPWGIPVLRVDCAFSPNEHAMREHMLASLNEMIAAAGARVTGAPHYFEPGGLVHEMGTARMGRDRKTSVLNRFAQCWDAPNVYVMDGAAWTSGAWQNPTFTMMAIAGRASEHLASEMKQGNI